MTGLFIAAAGAIGTFYLYTAAAFGWRGLAVAPRATGAVGPTRTSWVERSGLRSGELGQLAVVAATFGLAGVAAGFAVFGGVAAAVVVGGFAAWFPVAGRRLEARRQRTRAQQAWPRMIEEMRVITGSLGRSVPQALFDVGARAPAAMRPAFAAAHREWLLSTDFARTVAMLQHDLADPTADAVLETLLVAHEIGGTDLDQRLEALAAARVVDLEGRRDATAKQAGVRFARWFVLAVPAGMALAGMSVGNGRAAYATAEGQAIVVVALAVIVGCWLWADRIMRLPEEQRVLTGSNKPT